MAWSQQTPDLGRWSVRKVSCAIAKSAVGIVLRSISVADAAMPAMPNQEGHESPLKDVRRYHLNISRFRVKLPSTLLIILRKSFLSNTEVAAAKVVTSGTVSGRLLICELAFSLYQSKLEHWSDVQQNPQIRYSPSSDKLSKDLVHL